MSNERSGLPGIVTAVRHFVCDVAGAPGPVHGAAVAGEDDTSDAAPSNAVAAEPAKYARNLPYLVMRSSPDEPAPDRPANTIDHFASNFHPILNNYPKDSINIFCLWQS